MRPLFQGIARFRELHVDVRRLSFVQVWIAVIAIAVEGAAAAAVDASTQVAPPTESVSGRATPAAATRIVSLAPAATEWIAALGRLDGLIGRTEDCDFPLQGLDRIPSVGAFLSPNLEAVLQLRPRVVVATDSFNPSRLAEIVRSGVSVFLLNTKTMDGLAESILKLGLLLNAHERARVLVDQLKKARSSRHRAAKGSRTMLAIIDVQGRYLASRDSFVGEIFSDAGWVNLAPTDGAFPQVSEQWLRGQRPEDVFVFQKGADAEDAGSRSSGVNLKVLSALEGLWPGKLRVAQKIGVLSAAGKNAKAARVIELPSDLFMRPGPRLVQAFEMLARWRSDNRAGL